MENSLKPNLYFVGAGGIGMAALVRYFLALKHNVAGYDRASSDLTTRLEQEGAALIYEDNPDLIPASMRFPDDTLVIYTPAIPDDNQILSYFRTHGHEVIKRSEALGRITRTGKGICVAGSHGKTTTCSMIANIMRTSEAGCNAFLGGILRNVDSNLVLNPASEWAVIEADEYDRSFHRLKPEIAVITSTDPDHLDIYGDKEHYIEAFEHFTSLINQDGVLLLHAGLTLHPRTDITVKTFTYSAFEQADYYASDIRFTEGRLLFDLHGPGFDYKDIELGTPIEINVDNAVAAAAASICAGASEHDVRIGLKTFMGAKRRFEIHLHPGQGRAILIDDYAHSPNEIRASLRSVRKLFPGRHITVVFQPHLYTRTRDFSHEFAKALSEADRVVLPEIYPAREQPIPGVDSQLILRDVQAREKMFIPRADLVEWIKNSNFEVLITLGAADLDRLLPSIKEALS